MNNGRFKTFGMRLVGTGFAMLILAVFKPFGLGSLQFMAYVHVVAVAVLGILVCMLSDFVLQYVVRRPATLEGDVNVVVRRNRLFQFINTPLLSLIVCLYRHFVLSDIAEGNRFSLSNFVDTLLILGFCSFLIGLYWRFKFRSRYLTMELQETRLLNEQLQRLQSRVEQTEPSGESGASANDSHLDEDLVLTGTTSERVTLHVADLLYLESVGNYVKVCHLVDGVARYEMLRVTLRQIEDVLQPYTMIVRCHRSFLVNLKQVEQIVSQSGAMQLLIRHCNDQLPVSRSNVAQIRGAIKS